MAQEQSEKENKSNSNESSRDSGSRRGSSSSSRRVVRGGRPYNRRGRYQPRRKVCLYCAHPEKTIDWKNLDDLRRFTNDSGGIYPRRKTGLCAKHQRRIATAVKRARHIALLPYTSEHVRIMGQGRG